MLTLSLLRHAKSSWVDPRIEDSQRPLARRGVKAGDAMAAHFLESGFRPDLVLCSISVRTRQTLDLVLASFGTPAPEISFEDDLYLAAPTDLLERLHVLEQEPRHVLVIGHNPGLHALALDLIGSGGRDEIVALATKLPTLGLATITFDVVDWREVRPTRGHLARFLVPRALA